MLALMKFDAHHCQSDLIVTCSALSCVPTAPILEEGTYPVGWNSVSHS